MNRTGWSKWIMEHFVALAVASVIIFVLFIYLPL